MVFRDLNQEPALTARSLTAHHAADGRPASKKEPLVSGSYLANHYLRGPSGADIRRRYFLVVRNPNKLRIASAAVVNSYLEQDFGSAVEQGGARGEL
ncbi:hypothetical protein AOLI_G00075940 [Acnodon oligacanthus]